MVRLIQILAGMMLRGAEMNFKTDGTRAGEGDEARFWMLDDGVAECWTGAGTEVDHAVGNAGLLEDFNEARGDCGRVARGLEDDRVAGDDGSGRHAGHDGEGKIPGRNHRTHAERNVEELVAFAGILNGRDGRGQAQRFAGVELEEVDGFAHVSIGLGPVFADFVGEPGHELELAPANRLRGPKQQRDARFDRGLAPGIEGVQRGSHGSIYLCRAGHLMHTDNLRRPRGIDGANPLRSLEPLAADDERVLAAEMRGHLVESVAHGARIFRVAEVGKGLVRKPALGGERFDGARKTSDSHNETSLRQ